MGEEDVEEMLKLFQSVTTFSEVEEIRTFLKSPFQKVLPIKKFKLPDKN